MVEKQFNYLPQEPFPQELCDANDQAWHDQFDQAPNKVSIKNLSITYDNRPVLRKINLDIKEHEIFGIIGPSNSGKTSLLKAINRMDLFTPGMKISGDISLNGRSVKTVKNIFALRQAIGVVFPLPVGLPMSIYDNVTLSPRLRGVKKKAELDSIVERCLTKAALWDEVKDRLNSLGSLLSGGQQQRLTIARALSQDPELLMLDEFSIAVDPVTTMKIEEVLKDLRKEMTILLVTNLTQQARRITDRTAFFLEGDCVEIATTENLFIDDRLNQRTVDYIRGRFG